MKIKMLSTALKQKHFIIWFVQSFLVIKVCTELCYITYLIIKQIPIFQMKDERSSGVGVYSSNTFTKISQTTYYKKYVTWQVPYTVL